MKTAISIPDTLFQSAETLAHRFGMTRSELYSKAIEAFINNQKNQGVTESLNKIYATESNNLDDEYQSLQIHSLDKDQW